MKYKPTSSSQGLAKTGNKHQTEGSVQKQQDYHYQTQDAPHKANNGLKSSIMKQINGDMSSNPQTSQNVSYNQSIA